jgi:flagellar M-ring protein FliF
MADIKDTIGQAGKFWAGRNMRQKQFLLAGAAVTVLLLGLFVRLMGTPDYKPLTSGLDAAGAQKLAAQLDAQNIPHRISTDGTTISVPADKVDAARMATASLGSAHSERTGFELFDKMSWGQTEFDQKVTYQRALEGELERTIETLSDVQSARVHLVMPTDSVFLDRERGAKASVILKLRGNGLSKDAVLAISRLVSGAVDELKPEDVSIVDADSARSLGLGHDGEQDGETLESTLTQRLITTLEPVVGTDKIRASVNVIHDQGSTDQSEEKYDPSVSALLSDQKSQEQSSSGAIASTGVPGTSSNIPAAKAKAPAPQQQPVQTSMTENAQYGVNKVITHTVMPAGRIQRVTAAVLVDDAVVKTVQGGKTTYTRHKRSQDELNKIQLLAEAVIGFDAKRGDTISVQDMSFDSALAEDLPAPNLMGKIAKDLPSYSPILRPVSLLALCLLVYMFMVRPIQKQAFSPATAALPSGTAHPALAAGHGSHGSQGLAASAGSERLQMNAAEPDANTERATTLKAQTIDLIKKKPENTTRAIQAWMREEPS